MFFFFFKQKTAYEITVRDWSSDVCSSDLARLPRCHGGALGADGVHERREAAAGDDRRRGRAGDLNPGPPWARAARLFRRGVLSDPRAARRARGRLKELGARQAAVARRDVAELGGELLGQAVDDVHRAVLS